MRTKTSVKSKVVTAKVAENIKDEAEKFLNDLGMARSQAINVFHGKIFSMTDCLLPYKGFTLQEKNRNIWFK